jgi:hypothetical protein
MPLDALARHDREEKGEENGERGRDIESERARERGPGPEPLNKKAIGQDLEAAKHLLVIRNQDSFSGFMVRVDGQDIWLWCWSGYMVMVVDGQDIWLWWLG